MQACACQVLCLVLDSLSYFHNVKSCIGLHESFKTSVFSSVYMRIK